MNFLFMSIALICSLSTFAVEKIVESNQGKKAKCHHEIRTIGFNEKLYDCEKNPSVR